jgi:hypothetical protein
LDANLQLLMQAVDLAYQSRETIQQASRVGQRLHPPDGRSLGANSTTSSEASFPRSFFRTDAEAGEAAVAILPRLIRCITSAQVVAAMAAGLLEGGD